MKVPVTGEQNFNWCAPGLSRGRRHISRQFKTSALATIVFVGVVESWF